MFWELWLLDVAFLFDCFSTYLMNWAQKLWPTPKTICSFVRSEFITHQSNLAAIRGSPKSAQCERSPAFITLSRIANPVDHPCCVGPMPVASAHKWFIGGADWSRRGVTSLRWRRRDVTRTNWWRTTGVIGARARPRLIIARARRPNVGRSAPCYNIADSDTHWQDLTLPRPRTAMQRTFGSSKIQKFCQPSTLFPRNCHVIKLNYIRGSCCFSLSLTAICRKKHVNKP